MRPPRCKPLLVLTLALGVATAAFAQSGGETDHGDPFSMVLLELGLVIFVAMLGRYAAGRLGQPSVLGELMIGVAVGNLGYWLGIPIFTAVMHLGELQPIFDEGWSGGQSFPQAAHAVLSDSAFREGGAGEQLVALLTGPNAGHVAPMVLALWVFSNLGVILLLFLVGLESSVGEMRQVGGRASLVAIVGVALPFFLGLGVASWMLPGDGMPAHLFLAATLCATSVGITARVFRDLDRVQTAEAKVILGAAVIDDVLGLIILAVVVGIVANGEVDLVALAQIGGVSLLFLGVILVFGERVTAAIAPIFESLDRYHGKLLFPLSGAFLLAWAANQIHLAAIVGAFAAGLILSDDQFRTREDETIERLLAPLEAIFAPIFFVLMGMQVDLATLLEPQTVWIATALTAAAVVGKVAAGVTAHPATDRLSVGIGMIPRGEVGLIFASIGRGLGVVGDSLFSAIVVMVMITTLMTPIALRWSLFRNPGSQDPPPDEAP